jgi:hypothetical protein
MAELSSTQVRALVDHAEPLTVAEVMSRRSVVPSGHQRRRLSVFAVAAVVIVIAIVTGLVLTTRDSRSPRIVSNQGAPVTPSVSKLEVGEANAIATHGGTVWVAGNGVVRRVDARANAVTATVTVPGLGAASVSSGDPASVGITTGFGSVWITSSGTGTLTRIDESTNRILATVRLPGVAAPATAGGRLWAITPAAKPDRVRVVPVDPATNRPGRPVELPGKRFAPLSVLQGSGSTLFVGGRPQLVQIDTRTRKTRTVSGLPREGFVALARSGGDVLVLTGSHRVVAVDAASLEVTRRSGRFVTALLIAAGRANIWVSQFRPGTTAGQIFRLDPTTLRRAGPAIDVVPMPSALAESASTLWAANRDDGTLTRIDLAADPAPSTACQQSVPLNRYGADGLPPVGAGVTNRATATSLLTNQEPALRIRFPNATAITIGPGYGRAWTRDPDGRTVVITVPDLAIHVSLPNRSECPSEATLIQLQTVSTPRSFPAHYQPPLPVFVDAPA